jgi:hypothetical protein
MKLAPLAAAFVVVTTASVAHARGDDPRLDEARRAHDALDFERCIAVSSQPAPAESTDLDRGEVEVLAGACSFELGKTAEAREHFRRGLRIDPRAVLPPESSPKIVEAFGRAQADVRSESERTATTTTPAPVPARAEASPLRAPPRAETPARTPIVALSIAGAAVVLGVVGSYGYLRARSLESDANAARFESDAYALGDRAKSSIVVANVGFIGALALAAIALGVWVGVER